MKKKIVLSLLALVLVLAVIPLLSNKAEAATVKSGTCGTNVTWTLDDEGTLTISGTGAMKDYSIWSSGPWYNNRTSIKTIVIEDGVTSIGSYAFESCSSLTSVTIPSSVASIGGYAFYLCDSLTSVTIPKGVTSIGDGAFIGCISLTEILVENGNSFFTSADGVLFNKDKTTLVCFPGGKSGEYVVPASVTSIVSDAFSNCISLTSVTIPEGVTSIGICAFSNCGSLTSVTIPSSVTSIGNAAFESCSRLTEITFEGSVPSISNTAFNLVTASAYYPAGDASYTDAVKQNYGGTLTWVGKQELSGSCGSNVTWKLGIDGTLTISGTGAMKEYTSWSSAPWYNNRTSIKTIVIEDGVTSIGGDAFYGCSSLTSVTIPSSVTSIGIYAFYYCDSLTSVTIPEGVTSIGRYAFTGCSSLTSVTIPSSVTSIGNYAFSNCFDLTSVTILEGVTSIGYGAFYNCRSLTSVMIPSSVTSIGEGTFYWCSSLTEITFEGSAPSIGSYAFYYVTATAYYPAGDPSYTDAVKQDYGGTLTWVGKQEHSGSCGSNVTWKLGMDGTMTISGKGAMTNYARGSAPWYPYRSEIKKVVISDGVTSIGNAAFEGCSNLKMVILEGNAPTIISNAFTGVTSLVQYPYTNTTYTDAVKLNYGGNLTWVQDHTPGPAPTCTADQVCVDCGMTLAEKLGHTPGAVATCTTEQVCTVCYEVLVGKQDHTPGAPASCISEQICTVCNVVLVGKQGHTAGAQATCTTDQVCTVCNMVLVPKYGHMAGADATCTADQTCMDCGAVLTPKLGHQFDQYGFDQLDHWQECKVCGEKGEVLPHRLIERTEDQKRIIYCSCGYTEEEDITDPGESDPSDHEQNPLAKLLENLLDSVKNMTETTALVVFIVIGLAAVIVVTVIVIVIVKLTKKKKD